ncbi:MAG: hypothetical protein U0271_33490 [Polyangiaceae bacterium]
MSLAEENAQVLSLVQAMIGAISPNMRRVTLVVPAPRAVRLTFVLERDDPQDREEIDDIVAEFEGLQPGGIELAKNVIISSDPGIFATLEGRTVFGRKEG